MLHFLGRTPETREKEGEKKKQSQWMENLTIVVTNELLTPSVITDRCVQSVT